jgi:hypothetical protein
MPARAGNKIVLRPRHWWLGLAEIGPRTSDPYHSGRRMNCLGPCQSPKGS